ncbi:hypothetical protein L208DRAFT_1195056, partial [Tricholoma matsutake]
CILSAGTNPYVSIQDWIQNYSESSQFRCSECNQHLIHSFSFLSVPAIVIFEFEGKILKIDSEGTIVSRNNQHSTMKLQGVIYHGEGDYISCIVVNQQLWYHDGITTGANMVYEG